VSRTRYAAPGSDPDASPERHLSSSKLRGIQIGLNVICRVGRIRSERERACMIWLHNYARLQNLTADALSEELDLSKPEIRAALTDPEADLARFVRQVEAIRKQFEAALKPLVDTEPTKIVRAGLSMALKSKKIVDVIGFTRIGKTVPALDWFKRFAMDRGIYFNCPSDESDRNFIWAWARAMGIGAGQSKKTCQIVPQIQGCLGKGMIELVIVDEGHFLWPADQKAKPKRIEFLRSSYDMFNPAQIGVVNLTTPQHSISMNLALANNKRWAPGQWEGRAIPFHLPEVVSDKDLADVARYHAPDFSDGMIAALVLHAKATAGFCGAMVNAIELARFLAEEKGEKKVSANTLLQAQAQMTRNTAVGQAAKALAAKKSGKITALKEAKLLGALMMAAGFPLPTPKLHVTVVAAPVHTRNLFGPIEEVAGKRLEVLERNPQGDCLCLFRGIRGVNIVDVDHRDIERPKEGSVIIALCFLSLGLSFVALMFAMANRKRIADEVRSEFGDPTAYTVVTDGRAYRVRGPFDTFYTMTIYDLGEAKKYAAQLASWYRFLSKEEKQWKPVEERKAA
jgi:AAA domain